MCRRYEDTGRRRKSFLKSAYGEVQEIQTQYNEGLITNGERYNKVIDIWAQATEEIAQEMLKRSRHRYGTRCK